MKTAKLNPKPKGTLPALQPLKEASRLDKLKAQHRKTMPGGTENPGTTFLNLKNQ
jgi:hypothetical protein